MAYCTVDNLLKRYDKRLIAQMSNDDNTSAINVPNVNAALDDATEDIRMAGMQGGAYTQAQLDELSTNSNNAVIRLCADLAFRHLANRRGQGTDPAVSARVKESMDLLDKIRIGGRVFNVVGILSADTPVLLTLTADQQKNITPLTESDFFNGPDKTRTILG